MSEVIYPANPHHMVEALRRLINASRHVSGPSYETAYTITSDLDIPKLWIDALLIAWKDRAKRRVKNAYMKAMKQKTPVRYIAPMLIPSIDLRLPDEPFRKNCICRLCGKTPENNKRTWHKACWEALEPHTSRYWQKMRRITYERDSRRCCKCNLLVDAKKWDKTTLRQWKRDNNIKGSIYQIDHIKPISESGLHHVDNLQTLCVPCHKRKTISEAQTRAHNRNQIIDTD